MGRKFTDNTEVFPEIDDIVPGARPGRSPEEDVKNLAGDVPRIRLTDGRTAMQELESGTISTAGWYTIAETDAETRIVNARVFVHYAFIGGLGCDVAFCGSAVAKNHINTTIKLRDNTANNASLSVNQVTSFRLAKSDSINTAGWKLQVYLAPTSGHVYHVALQDNVAWNDSPGLKLVTPYLDNTPTLPDGSTVGTFLEAGEELSFTGLLTSAYWPYVTARKIDNTTLYCTVMWPETPKQGTGLTFTYPAGPLYVRDGGGNFGAIASAPTISSVVFTGKIVSFILTTGVSSFSTLNQGPCQFIHPGGTSYLTIT